MLGAREIVGGAEEDGASQRGADEKSRPVRQRALELSQAGLRVLLLSRTTGELSGETLPARLTAAGLVILSERVRPDAVRTLKYFSEQGVTLKVISGDTPATVQTIASRAGLPGADKAVDARTLPEGDALVSKMEEMSVFGRVTPDQKRSMVAALQAGVTRWP